MKWPSSISIEEAVHNVYRLHRILYHAFEFWSVSASYDSFKNATKIMLHRPRSIIGIKMQHAMMMSLDENAKRHMFYIPGCSFAMNLEKEKKIHLWTHQAIWIETHLALNEMFNVLCSMKNGFSWKGESYLDGIRTPSIEELIVKADMEEDDEDRKIEENNISWLKTMSILNDNIGLTNAMPISDEYDMSF